CEPDRRQRSAEPPATARGVLGPHGRQGLLEWVGGLGGGGPALVLLEGLWLRRSRLLRAQSAGFPGTPHAVGRRSRGLLLDGSPRKDASRARQFLRPQPRQAPAYRRCRSCAHQPDAILRQP